MLRLTVIGGAEHYAPSSAGRDVFAFIWAEPWGAKPPSSFLLFFFSLFLMKGMALNLYSNAKGINRWKRGEKGSECRPVGDCIGIW